MTGTIDFGRAHYNATGVTARIRDALLKIAPEEQRPTVAGIAAMDRGAPAWQNAGRCINVLMPTLGKARPQVTRRSVGRLYPVSPLPGLKPLGHSVAYADFRGDQRPGRTQFLTQCRYVDSKILQVARMGRTPD